MARPQVADRGEALQVWRVAANILNKKSRTPDKGWSFSLRVGRGADLAQERGQWRALVNTVMNLWLP
jgi:hypothetical protein